MIVISISHSQSRCDLHRHQLLDEQLASVGDVDTANALGALADCALELLLGEVGLADETTGFTDVHAVAVADLEQPLFQEASAAVRDHAVTLHLSESQATIPGPTFSGLSREDLNGSSTSGMHLVVNHVLQSLIECWSKEDHDLHLLASEPVVHDLVASKLIAQRVKFG